MSVFVSGLFYYFIVSYEQLMGFAGRIPCKYSWIDNVAIPIFLSNPFVGYTVFQCILYADIAFI